ITVESMFSMNRAVATMSGIRRSLFMVIRGKKGGRKREQGCIIPLPHRLLRNPEYHLNPAYRRRSSDDDLCPRRFAAAARAAPERAAFCGDFQPGADGLLRDFRAVFSRPAAGAVGACGDRGSYETGRAPASGGGGGDPPARPAAGLSALKPD